MFALYNLAVCVHSKQQSMDQIIFVLGIPAIGILACIAISYLIAEGKDIEQPAEVEG